MHIKRLYRNGHSLCLVLPRDIVRELQLYPGAIVTLRYDHLHRVILERLEATLAREPRALLPPRRTDP